MVELLVATVVLVIAVLALLAAYDQAFFSLRSAAQTSSAGLLAENQLELYASLPYSSLGLDATTLSSVQASDPTYSSDESALPGTGTDVTISGCGSSPQCSPVQTLTGSDHHSYKLETFIRLLANPSYSSWSETVITVIVRDLDKADAKVVTMQTAYDPGP
jgi:Tfp pilus assembly protein PilV